MTLPLPTRRILPLLALVVLTGTAVAALWQDEPPLPVLRDTPDDADPRQHLLETIYGEILYPAAAREVKRSGVYYLALPIDSSGAVTVVQALAAFPEYAVPLELVIIGYQNDHDMPVPERSGDPGDTALTEETLRIGRSLSDIGFLPKDEGGRRLPDTLYLSFSFSLE